MSSNRLIIVSNRLPVSLQRRGAGYSVHPSAGGLATSLNALRERMPMLWLGWPGVSVTDPDERRAVASRLEDEFGCIPLFLPQPAFDRYYSGFSNGCLWPLFHYFPQYAHYSEHEWRAYQQVNGLFSEKLLEILQPSDTVWVHDYHLMLLPELVRQARPEATIGFFLHIPFPSYEIFRHLPWRESILRGLLGADLVGFHSFGYVRHFLSSLLRILGLDHEFGRVTLADRQVKADTFPLGVDMARFEAAKDDPGVRQRLEGLRRETAGRKVVLSVDRLDFTKGILQRLRAFEGFLTRFPEWRGKVVLITLCVPSRTRVPEYRALKRQVDELVGRINGRYGQPEWTPIWYLYRFLPFEQLLPLYRLADVALVTPLRDGMNLVAKEYLAARPESTGALVLSETAGSADELGEALIVNPHDEAAIIEALRRALSMSEAEQVDRNTPMLARLRRYNTVRWADDILTELEQARRQRTQRRPRLLHGPLRQELLHGFQHSRSRLLLLDYDGTLVPFKGHPLQAAPDEGLCRILQRLAGRRGNRLVVISGRDAGTLERWLGETGADLVAEHGGSLRRADDSEWKSAADDLPQGWKDEIRPVLQVYADRTPGAEVEQKGLMLVWHYRRAEPELGSLRAKELTDHLEGYVANTPLHVLQGDRVVGIKPSSVSKGKAALAWLSEGTTYDFTLAVGDDVTDEDMFAAMPEDSWTIKVGYGGASGASYLLPGVEAVRQLLDELAGS